MLYLTLRADNRTTTASDRRWIVGAELYDGSSVQEAGFLDLPGTRMRYQVHNDGWEELAQTLSDLNRRWQWGGLRAGALRSHLAVISFGAAWATWRLRLVASSAHAAKPASADRLTRLARRNHGLDLTSNGNLASELYLVGVAAGHLMRDQLDQTVTRLPREKPPRDKVELLLAGR